MKRLAFFVVFFVVMVGCTSTSVYADLPSQYQQSNNEMVQGCLSILGYAPGPIDGVFGPQTTAAYAQYVVKVRQINARIGVSLSDTQVAVIFFRDCAQQAIELYGLKPCDCPSPRDTEFEKQLKILQEKGK